MKERFKMRRVYKRGVGNILGHIHKFMNLIHILANVTGTYGVWDSERGGDGKWKRLKAESASKGRNSVKVTFFVDSTTEVL